MFLNDGNTERAISYFNQALEREPGNKAALEGLGVAKSRL